MEDAQTRYRAGWAGDFDGRPELEAGLAGTASPDARAWALALAGQRWCAGPSAAFPYAPAQLKPLIGASPTALGAACFQGSRAAILAFDPGLAAEWAELYRGVLGASPTTADRIWLGVAEGWSRIVGAHEPIQAVDVLEAEARAAGDAPLVIEATALGAWNAMRLGDVEAATSLGRRASRMARTEALPQQEYLANVVLARIRRLSGRAHLAVHILRALLQVASTPWHRWMKWELSLAGGHVDGPEGPSQQLLQVVAAALGGDLRAYDQQATNLVQLTQPVAILWRDAAALLSMLDLRNGEGGSEATDAWLRGKSTGLAPRGLHGVTAFDHSARAGEPVWVLGSQEGARRVLSVGLPLAGPNVHALMPGRRRRGRTDAAIADLLLQGEMARDEEEFFERLYGFSYNPAVHQGARDTLYYRVRERLGEQGELERSRGQLRIRLREAIAVPDPRCAPPPENIILGILAQKGSSTAKETAESLGLPLRTVQHALKSLASDGFCRVERKGRELRYQVEDTTFCEPTRST
ncbi:MAG: helix-turn-helix domain-containing protein [Myxococcota bacterium]